MRVMYNKNTIIGTCVIDIGGLLNIDDNGPFFYMVSTMMSLRTHMHP